NWALHEACRQYAAWRKQGEAPPRLAVNVSAEQIRDPLLVQSVRNTLLRADLPPWALVLELPEAALLGERADNRDHGREAVVNAVGATLAALAELGVKLALDDFGTGFSSIGCLRRYPIELVKIDRSFIADLPHGAPATAMTGAIVLMARSLGKQTVAEGVE